MPNPIKHSFYLLFKAEDLLPLATGTIVLTILTDNISGLLSKTLENRLGSPLLANLILILIPILLAILFLSLYTTWRDRRLTQLQHTNPNQQPPTPHKGLILLVSRQKACQKAIQYHHPTLQRCWLICSQKTLEIAQNLQTENPELYTKAPFILSRDDINNPIACQTLIDQIYTQHLPPGWQETDIIADYTGMTAHASVGVALACLSTGRPLQYTPALYDGDRIIGSASPMAITLNPPLQLPPAPPRRDRHRPVSADQKIGR